MSFNLKHICQQNIFEREINKKPAAEYSHKGSY